MRLRHRRAIAAREPSVAERSVAGRQIPLFRLVAFSDLGEKRRYRARRAFELLRQPPLRRFARQLHRLLRAVPLPCEKPHQAQCDARADQGNRRQAPRISRAARVGENPRAQRIGRGDGQTCDGQRVPRPRAMLAGGFHVDLADAALATEINQLGDAPGVVGEPIKGAAGADMRLEPILEDIDMHIVLRRLAFVGRSLASHGVRSSLSRQLKHLANHVTSGARSFPQANAKLARRRGGWPTGAEIRRLPPPSLRRFGPIDKRERRGAVRSDKSGRKKEGRESFSHLWEKAASRSEVG